MSMENALVVMLDSISLELVVQIVYQEHGVLEDQSQVVLLVHWKMVVYHAVK
jgi:hypothetical protein